MSGTILGDLVKKWLERKKSRKKEREKKGKRGKKTGIEVEKRKSQSYLTFSSKIISRRVAKGWKTAGSKGERARTEGARTSKREWKKEAKKAKEARGRGGKRMGGRGKWKRRKDGSKKRGTAVERRARIQRACTMCRGKSARVGERRKETKQRGPIKAESDLNLERLMHEKPGY